jgi:hypothetical protein
MAAFRRPPQCRGHSFGHGLSMWCSVRDYRIKFPLAAFRYKRCWTNKQARSVSKAFRKTKENAAACMYFF